MISVIIRTISKWVSIPVATAHRHCWKTTHVNRWQIPTRQVCRCGVARTAKTNPERIIIAGRAWPKMEWRWEYSDGFVGRWRKIGSLVC